MKPDYTPRYLLLILSIATGFSLLIAPLHHAAAQQDRGNQQDQQNERDQRPGSSSIRTFDDVTLERIYPDELPDFRPGLPSNNSRHDVSDLPQTLGGEELRRVSVLLNSTTIEIIAVHTPPRPYRATEMVYRGHALWISPSEDGADPVLITTADWLEGADQVYALLDDARETLNERELTIGTSEPVPLEEFTASNRGFLDSHASDLIPLAIDEQDRHVNLARLSPPKESKLPTPRRGLIIHDMDASMPGTIFGFSPSTGSSIIPVGYHDSSELALEYSFYFLTTFAAILGAPIIGPNGDLLGITALRYPVEPDKTMAIPPGAIHSFLDTGRADVEIDPEVE